MRNVHRKKGFTLPELLIVVGILAILMAVAFIGVTNYLRSMEKLEYDNYAKELFVAAQNHLTMAESQGYLGKSSTPGFFGKEEKAADGGVDNPGTDVYYFVTTEDVVDNADILLSQILPFGSVDETVRNGNSEFIIRYHKPSAQILDVFYWTSTGSRFYHSYAGVSDYNNFLANTSKSYLRSYPGDNSVINPVIGYYGGTGAPNLLPQGEALVAPEIKVINAEKLYVEITDKNENTAIEENGYVLKLLLTGETSGAKKEVELIKTIEENGTKETISSDTKYAANQYRVILDDISSDNSDSPVANQFYNFIKTDVTPGSGGLMQPGENIIIQAVALNNQMLTNVAYSAAQTTNSLFGEGTTVSTADSTSSTALISNIRHLENLSKTISGVQWKELNYNLAQQTVDISWTEFQNKIGDMDASIGDVTKIFVCDFSGKFYSNGSGYFYPIDISVAEGEKWEYDGKNHSISDVVVSGADRNVGLFGTVEGPGSGRSYCKISNVKLIDFSITGSQDGGAAGALAGSVSTATISNILAYNNTRKKNLAGDSVSIDVEGAGSTGGLIGKVKLSTIDKCAAAVLVKSRDGAAGGLIGSANNATNDGTMLRGCYSGGYTEKNGTYSKTHYNVVGKTAAGGLIGDAQYAEIRYCYSTCSAYLDNTSGHVGGLIGNSEVVDDNKIFCCYATGLVGVDSGYDESSTYIGAFAGELNSSLIETDVVGRHNYNYYFRIVNESKDSEGKFVYMDPVGYKPTEKVITAITALDADASSYQSFVEDPVSWNPSSPYDDSLKVYYQGTYNLKSVARLAALSSDSSLANELNNKDINNAIEFYVNTHYGDWPAPETWVFNEK